MPYLDANGDHHSGSCPSAAASVSQRHTNLTSVLFKFALEAGAIAKREPSPYNLFQGLLPPGQCASLFPKSTSADYKSKAKEIVDLLSQATVDKAKIADLTRKLPRLDPANSGSLRVDLALVNPSNQKAYLIDGSSTRLALHIVIANSRMCQNAWSLRPRQLRRSPLSPCDGTPPSQSPLKPR